MPMFTATSPDGTQTRQFWDSAQFASYRRQGWVSGDHNDEWADKTNADLDRTTNRVLRYFAPCWQSYREELARRIRAGHADNDYTVTGPIEAASDPASLEVEH